MASYSPFAWHDFFMGTIGAAAALTGLLFVAISINLQQILRYPHLPGRAAGTLGILVSALVVSGFALCTGTRRSRPWDRNRGSREWSWPYRPFG